jgi:Zn-dependent protease
MFRLFGFDVKVRTGFVIFLALIAFIYPDGYGIYLAAAIAVFTLIHELGHAVAARSSGATASISLDFMAGYTSFSTPRPLRGARKALISFAGPLSQIVVSVTVLLAMGVEPWSIDSVRDGSIAARAIWWAGPMIGLLNLVPVLPLDGGHLAQTALEGVLRRPALREMAIVSVAVTIGVAVTMAATGNTGFVIFIAFLVIGQVQILQRTSNRAPKPQPAHAWADDGFMQSHAASPWQLAYRAAAAGRHDEAERLILADLLTDAADSSDRARWAPPYDAPAEALRAVVEVLPTELPQGNAYSQRVLAEVLLATGFPRAGGEYAAAGFDRHRTPMLAVLVARAAARMGDQANALQWARAALEAAAGRPEDERALVGRVLDLAPELDGVRADPLFLAGRAALH